MNFVNFLNDPTIFNRLLDQTRLIDEIYKAISDMDMAAAVLSALRAMRVTGTVPFIPRGRKNAKLSSDFRVQGNFFFNCAEYEQALISYNQALLAAPKGSIELIQAYSNRTAIFVKIHAYSACLKDIDVCFKLGCPDDLKEKLSQRRDKCNSHIWEEKLKIEFMNSRFPKEFFKFNSKRHSEVPCLSEDVDIVSESGDWKVIAAKNIKVGALLALETAYTTWSGKNRSFMSCYYCQKLTLNLIPCDNCCLALFCNETCKELCVKEYHHVECELMDVLNILNAGYKFRLTVKTVLKLKTQCKTWSKLINESKNIGASRLKTSSVNEIYDGNNVSSILSFAEDRHFVHGAIYNNSFLYAMIVHHLEVVPDFYPPASSSSFLEAQKCIAKLLMSLDIMWIFIPEMENAAELLTLSKIGNNVPSHFGWFPFTGKLKHSCEPNVLMVGLDKEVGLVAIKPIKKMTELRVSYVGHWYNHLYKPELRALKIYDTQFTTCSCRVCTEDWNVYKFLNSPLDKSQTEAVNSYNQVLKEVQLPIEDSYLFKETCKALALVDEAVHTRAHYGIFTQMFNQITMCQYAYTSNAMVAKPNKA